MLGCNPIFSALSQVPLTSETPASAPCRSLAIGPAAESVSGLQDCPPVEKRLFSLEDVFAPIPSKLTQKIQSLEFVDMSELLPDNIELQRRDDGSTRTDTHASGAGRRRSRQITSLLSWVQCFATYTAVVGDRHPGRVTCLLAYQRLIVREAQRNGGDGWKHYDGVFRKVAAANPLLNWSQPMASL